jgi:hypothetical protein
MRLHKYLIIAASLTVFAGQIPAFAGFNQGNKVTMGGQPVFSIACPAFGYSAEHRAWLAQDALDNALVVAYNRNPSAVRVERLNGAICVTLDGRKVATADATSANLEGLTPAQLADKWADGIRNFLSDNDRTTTYLAELTGQNPINAQVAVLERKLYAPPGTVLPVAFTTEISSETIKAGDPITGSLTEDVVIGGYAIPKGCVLSGIIEEPSPGAYTVAFTSMKLGDAPAVPIRAVLTGEYLTSNLSAHPVCTISMPYGIKPMPGLGVTQNSACRAPATIGVGTIGGSRGERLVLRRGINLVIAAGTPSAVVIEQPSRVAVVFSQHHM